MKTRSSTKVNRGSQLKITNIHVWLHLSTGPPLAQRPIKVSNLGNQQLANSIFDRIAWVSQVEVSPHVPVLLSTVIEAVFVTCTRLTCC